MLPVAGLWGRWRDDSVAQPNTTQGDAAMPLHFCHPNTPHRKLGMPEWFVSNLMMDRALDAVVRRAKTLDRKHDIPLSPATARTARRSISTATCHHRSAMP